LLRAFASAVAAENVRASATQNGNGSMPYRKGKLEGSELTLAELQVLKLLAAGWTTAEIVEKLGKARPTVQMPSRFCLFRLGAVNMPHAVALAYGLGIINERDLHESAPPPPRRQWIPRGPEPRKTPLLPTV